MDDILNGLKCISGHSRGDSADVQMEESGDSSESGDGSVCESLLTSRKKYVSVDQKSGGSTVASSGVVELPLTASNTETGFSNPADAHSPHCGGRMEESDSGAPDGGAIDGQSSMITGVSISGNKYDHGCNNPPHCESVDDVGGEGSTVPLKSDEKSQNKDKEVCNVGVDPFNALFKPREPARNRLADVEEPPVGLHLPQLDSGRRFAPACSGIPSYGVPSLHSYPPIGCHPQPLPFPPPVPPPPFGVMPPCLMPPPPPLAVVPPQRDYIADVHLLSNLPPQPLPPKGLVPPPPPPPPPFRRIREELPMSEGTLPVQGEPAVPSSAMDSDPPVEPPVESIQAADGTISSNLHPPHLPRPPLQGFVPPPLLRPTTTLPSKPAVSSPAMNTGCPADSSAVPALHRFHTQGGQLSSNLPPTPRPPPPPPPVLQHSMPSSAIAMASSIAPLGPGNRPPTLPPPPPPPPPPPSLPIREEVSECALPVNQEELMPVAVLPENNHVWTPHFEPEPPAPWSLPFCPPPLQAPPGLASSYPPGLPPSVLPPVLGMAAVEMSRVKEVLRGRGKRRAEDKYLFEANMTSTKLRCFDPPSERETAQSISKHLDTVVKVIEIISRQYIDQDNPRSIPKAFWGLCTETDKVAGRNMRFQSNVADARQKALVENSRHPVSSVIFSAEYNMQVHLPAGVKKVWFGPSYNQPTELPRSVVDVTFGHEFNQPVILPPQIRKVHFGHMFNWPLDLPQSLRDVHFGNSFNQPLTLPRGLKKAAFGNLFTHELGPLPPALEEIALKKWWNHDIELPHTIRACTFGKRFNKVVTLPPNVEKLVLGAIQPLPDPLPRSLKILSVCRKSKIIGLDDLVPIGCQVIRR